jgi:tetratricopeptide (TPR) repeat protein
VRVDLCLVFVKEFAMRSVSRFLSVPLLALSLGAGFAFANLGGEEAAESTDANFQDGVKAVENKDWKGAIELLNKAAEKEKSNADIQNLLGFSHRNAGNYEQAFKHYGEAIKLNPKHRNAYEYLGEAYLLTNNLDKAQEQFRNLERLCPRGCEQLDLLKGKIEAFQKKAASN